jgi:YggT family protein
MSTVINIVSLLFRLYGLLILIRVLLTWVNVSPYHPAVQLIHQVTEPVLAPFRRIIPPIGGTLDISPIVALILLEILSRVVVDLLLRL